MSCDRHDNALYKHGNASAALTCSNRRLARVGAKPGLWTLDWTHGLDCGLRFGLDFGLMRRV